MGGGAAPSAAAWAGAGRGGRRRAAPYPPPSVPREFLRGCGPRGRGTPPPSPGGGGKTPHQIAEASFKAVARALRQAVEPDPRAGGAVPSTKGAL